MVTVALVCDLKAGDEEVMDLTENTSSRSQPAFVLHNHIRLAVSGLMASLLDLLLLLGFSGCNN